MSADATSAQPTTHRRAHPALPAAAIRLAWEQIVRQHWRKVFNVAYKFVGKHDEAEDLTQDIFLKIFKSLDTFDRRANFQTWLISVSRNLCIDHYRSVRKERETIDRDVDAERAVAGVARARADRRARAARPRRAAAAGAGGAARHAAHGGADARHPGLWKLARRSKVLSDLKILRKMSCVRSSASSCLPTNL